MERYPCESILSINVLLDERLLTLQLRHGVWHSPYESSALTTEVIEFVQDRSLMQSPADIFREVVQSDLPGADSVAEHQIYYRWSKISMEQ